MTSFGGVGRGVHPLRWPRGMAVFEARDAAALLGAPGADRVAFAANATGALNIAIDGLFARRREGGHHGRFSQLGAAPVEQSARTSAVARSRWCRSMRVALDYEALERAVRGASLCGGHACFQPDGRCVGMMRPASPPSRMRRGCGGARRRADGGRVSAFHGRSRRRRGVLHRPQGLARSLRARAACALPRG